jgi:hypothetical protein
MTPNLQSKVIDSNIANLGGQLWAQKILK